MKRRCPWAEDHQPMLKNHFSEKDQVLKSGGMESIYAKTLAMLFNGANKKAPENNNEEGIYAPKFLLTTTGVGNCVSCVRLTNQVHRKCSPCSGPVCEDCHQICSNCQQIVCGNCSVVNRMSASVCLGCRD